MSKPQDWDLFLKHITKEYEINGKLREIFLVRFAYENWRKADKEIWELAEAASHETYKKQMTEIYSYFASTRPQGCPELDPSSKGPGKFQILREWFKELKYPEWHQKNSNCSPQVSPTFNNSLARSYIPYIERNNVEKDCYQEIHKLGALIHIKAPEKMGKTSLIQSIIAHANQSHYRTIHLNLQSAEANLFQSLDKFLRWFCANISRELGITPLLDDYWDEELFGSLVSCKTYWQSYLLGNLETPLVVAIDNLDKIFDYPLIFQDFLPMLRYWHEESNNLEVWQNLRLILATSTEAYLKLDANQSPFNVGKQIKLSGFDTEQILTFSRAYNLVIESEIATKLRNLVGGHPYLIKLALEALNQGKSNFESFWEQAPTQGGIYGAHLLHHWDNLQKQPHLVQGLKTVLETATGAEIEPILAYKLESMGLVTLAGNRAQISCQLYQSYFGDRFS